MSMASLEREIVATARNVLRNPKLRNKDILEWSTGDIKAGEGEVIVHLPAPLSVNVCVATEDDKRS